MQAVRERLDNVLCGNGGQAGGCEGLENGLGAREGVKCLRHHGAQRVGVDVGHDCQCRVPERLQEL